MKVLFADGANKSDGWGVSEFFRFLREYEILVIKALGFCYGDSGHAPSILLELCVSSVGATESVT